MILVVLNTNEFVSALIRRTGRQAEILGLWLDNLVQLAISEALWDEIAGVLRHPYFGRRYRIAENDVGELHQQLLDEAKWAPGAVTVSVVADDPDDNKVIACSVETDADYIISGDRHLLDLVSYDGIPIVNAAGFLHLLAERESSSP